MMGDDTACIPREGCIPEPDEGSWAAGLLFFTKSAVGLGDVPNAIYSNVRAKYRD